MASKTDEFVRSNQIARVMSPFFYMLQLSQWDLVELLWKHVCDQHNCCHFLLDNHVTCGELRRTVINLVGVQKKEPTNLFAVACTSLLRKSVWDTLSNLA